MDKNHIVEKTTSLLKKYGLKSMTMHEISAQLGISKNTLYNHFKNREKLLLECLTWMDVDADKILNKVESDNESIVIKIIGIYNTTVDYLSQFDSTFFFDLKKNSNLKAAMQTHINDYKLNRIMPLILQAKDRNLLIPNADVDDAVDCYMNFVPHFFSDFKDDPEAIKKHIILFLQKYFIETSEFHSCFTL